jgi:hypothetical protein
MAVVDLPPPPPAIVPAPEVRGASVVGNPIAVDASGNIVVAQATAGERRVGQMAQEVCRKYGNKNQQSNHHQ